jgi:hypothetical protein
VSGCWSAPVLGCDGRGVDKLAGLVVDGDRDLAELVTVLARVVGAEEEVSATSELDTEVGLGTTTVTTVQRREWRARGNSSGHEASFSFLGVLLKVTQGSSRVPFVPVHQVQHPITPGASRRRMVSTL